MTGKFHFTITTDAAYQQEKKKSCRTGQAIVSQVSAEELYTKRGLLNIVFNP